MALGPADEEDRGPGLDVSLEFAGARAITLSEIEIPIVGPDSRPCGQVVVEYREQFVRCVGDSAGVRTDRVCDVIYPNNTKYHWHLFTTEHKSRRVEAAGCAGWKVDGGGEGAQLWGFETLRGYCYINLERGMEGAVESAMSAVEQNDPWEVAGVVATPCVFQKLDGDWAELLAYQAGIACEFFQSPADTVRLRIQPAARPVRYTNDGVVIDLRSEFAIEDAAVKFLRPSDGFWPWDPRAPQFFQEFKAETVGPGGFLELTLRAGRTGTYMFSLEMSPVESQGRVPVPQSLWFEPTHREYVRKVAVSCDFPRCTP